jgi:hypothetical protein
VDFLLECIGFPPDHGLGALIQTVKAKGEPTPYRGPRGDSLRYPLAGGLEVRIERETGAERWNVWPYARVDHRLRMAVFETRAVPDSPFDRLLVGVANPRPPVAAGMDAGGEAPGTTLELEDEEFLLTAYVTDGLRLPRSLPVGHVLAISVAGFALDVSYVGPNEGSPSQGVLDRARGASFRTLGDEDDPGGCMEVSLRVRSLRHVRNPLTGAEVEIVEADAPGRPMPLFLSRWQLEAEGLPLPRPGWRVEGAFLFQGAIAGGLPRAAPRSFG